MIWIPAGLKDYILSFLMPSFRSYVITNVPPLAYTLVIDVLIGIQVVEFEEYITSQRKWGDYSSAEKVGLAVLVVSVLFGMVLGMKMYFLIQKEIERFNKKTKGKFQKLDDTAEKITV